MDESLKEKRLKISGLFKLDKVLSLIEQLKRINLRTNNNSPVECKTVIDIKILFQLVKNENLDNLLSQFFKKPVKPVEKT